MSSIPQFDGCRWWSIDTAGKGNAPSVAGIPFGRYPSDGQGDVDTAQANSDLADSARTVIEFVTVTHSDSSTGSPVYLVGLSSRSLVVWGNGLHTDPAGTIDTASGFSAYDFTPGDQAFIVANGGGSPNGLYTIASKTNDSQIVLATSIGSTALCSGVINPLMVMRVVGGDTDSANLSVEPNLEVTGALTNISTVVALESGTAQGDFAVTVGYRKLQRTD